MSYKKLGTVQLVDLMLLLRQKAPDLFEEAKSSAKNWDGATWAGKKIHLSQSLAQRIDDFLVAQEPPPAPSNPEQAKYVQKWVAGKKKAAEPKPEKSETDRFREETAALAIRERERIQRERAAAARLSYWETQGLLNTEANSNLIVEFISMLKVPFTASAVDTAVAKLRDRLEWYKPAPVELLSDGSPRLPIDTVPSRKHTVEQLRDLDARQRAVRKQ